MTKTINGVAYTTVSAIYGGETETQTALLIHDMADTDCNGDCIVTGYELPKDADDAQNILADTALTSDWTLDGGTGIYHIEA